MYCFFCIYANKFVISLAGFKKNSNFALVYNQSKMLSLAEAIEQYVVAQAKRLIESHPTTSLKEIAYMLGFQEPSAFHRYFKRVTGINTLEYRSSI